MTIQWANLKKCMVITYSNISKITFPVYPLHSENWSVVDSIVFVDNKIVDDRNMSGKTLGIRRLQTPYKSLYVLKNSLSTLSGIIKQKKNTFIDTQGTLFIYEKTKFVQLKYLPIQKIIKKEKNCLLFLQSCPSYFDIPRPPPSEIKFVGVLHLYKDPWLLYNYSEIYLKETKRKI